MHGLQTSYTIRTINCLRFDIVFGFLNERLIFYDLFCEGPSDLRIYASTVVRRLRAQNKLWLSILHSPGVLHFSEMLLNSCF